MNQVDSSGIIVEKMSEDIEISVPVTVSVQYLGLYLTWTLCLLVEGGMEM